MKKLLSVLMVLCLLAALMAGCGKKTEEPAPAEVPAVEEPVAEEPAAEPVTEEPAPEEQPAVEVEAPAVMTYAEYAAAELDSPVCVETYVQAKQGWWNDSVTVYSQDEDGAYFIYNMACSEADNALLTEGSKIRVTGYKAEWSGEVEIADATFELIEGNYVAEPADVTELLGTDELITRQNQKVRFTGLTVEPITDAEGKEAAFLYNWDGSGAEGTDSDLYFNVSFNGQTYTFVVEYYLCNETTEVYDAVRNLKVGDVIDVEGFLYWYDGVQPHVTSVTVG